MSEPHDLPDALTLLEAVRDFLTEHVEPLLEGQPRWHAKIAANVLVIVERELRLGPEHAIGHRQRLERLGFASDAELADSIRAGKLDDRLDQLVDELQGMVADKLAVARPDHIERRAGNV